MTAPAAPATNSVRIYAEDNGAGKTRLMALFATGSAVQSRLNPDTRGTMQTINFTDLTPDEANIVLAGLGELPAKSRWPDRQVEAAGRRADGTARN
jgi:hypothetical protein